MTVEAAMRQARAFHDVGHTNSVKSALPKKRPGDLENLLAVRGRLFARHSRHRTPFETA